MDSINPTTGQTTGTYEELDDTTLEARLEAAERTFEDGAVSPSMSAPP
jgi:acyl-CoA reductase-like NAD-dependent aldehyde dehydrogenase